MECGILLDDVLEHKKKERIMYRFCSVSLPVTLQADIFILTYTLCHQHIWVQLRVLLMGSTDAHGGPCGIASGTF